jgi:hypothetical protein
MEVILDAENLQDLEVFESLLQKDKNSIVNEALKLYFEEEAKRIEAEKDSQTNLSFNEFWDDVEL